MKPDTLVIIGVILIVTAERNINIFAGLGMVLIGMLRIWIEEEKGEKKP